MEVIQIWGEGSYLLSIMPKIKFHDKVGMGKRGGRPMCVHYDCTVYTACTVCSPSSQQQSVSRTRHQVQITSPQTQIIQQFSTYSSEKVLTRKMSWIVKWGYGTWNCTSHVIGKKMKLDCDKFHLSMQINFQHGVCLPAAPMPWDWVPRYRPSYIYISNMCTPLKPCYCPSLITITLSKWH